MMNIELPFEFGEHVYYVALDGLAKRVYLAEGNIFGYSVYKRKGEIDIRVNFKNDNGVEIDFVSGNKQKIENKVDEINKRNQKIFNGESK